MRPLPVCLCMAACAAPDVARPPGPGPVAATVAKSPDEPAPRDESSSVERMDVAAIVALALEVNPALRESRHGLDAAAGRAEQAGLWPNPRLSLEARDVPKHPIAIDRGGRWIVLSQPFALGGRIGAARAMAEADRDATELDVEVARRRLVADVRRACADVAAADAAFGLRHDTAAGFDELLAAARRRGESGAATQAEIASLEVDAERARVEVRRRERERAVAVAALRALLGGAAPRLAHVDWSSDRDAPADDVLEAPEPPQVLAAARRVESAERGVEEAKASRFPDIDVSVAYGRMGDPTEEQVEAGITIPLPLFDRNQGRIRERSGALRAARAAEDRVRTEVAQRRAAVLADLAASMEDLAAHRDRILPAAERISGQIESAFADGARSANDVILARRSLAEARLGLFESQRSVRRAQADLIEVGADAESQVRP